MPRLDLTLARMCNSYRTQFNIAEWKSFQNRFSLERDCIEFLFQMKWPTGYTCPRCHHRYAYIINTRRLPLYQCCDCRHQSSLIVGTIMERSRIPLSKWLSAFYLASRSNSMINAVQLRTLIQVTYKTAWSILHAIRHAISKVESDHVLSGQIKGGIGFCGQIPFSPTNARAKQEKPVVFAASLDEDGQPTSFKMKVVRTEHMTNKHLNNSGIREFMQKSVLNDARSKNFEFFQRFALYKIIPVKKLFDLTMYRFVRSYRGLTSKHLQLYLDEASYRINLTIQNINMFDHLTQLCMTTNRI